MGWIGIAVWLVVLMVSQDLIFSILFGVEYSFKPNFIEGIALKIFEHITLFWNIVDRNEKYFFTLSQISHF